MLLLLSNNINIQSPWMLSLEIFGSVCAAAADYRRIRYRPTIPAGASKVFINDIITLHNSLQDHEKISCSERSFHNFHFLYIFKTNGTELINESADVCFNFQAMWRHRPLKECSVLVEICVNVLSLVYILWVRSIQTSV